MFYYKHIDRSGKIVSLESRNRQSTSASELSMEIGESEYLALLEEMMANTEDAEEISDREALAIIVGGAGVC